LLSGNCESTTLRDLGTLLPGTSSGALAINEAGVVVGISARPEDDPIFADAFVFTAASGMQNLNDLIKPGLNI
jgi:probable HAF family extracellular repeat protein